MSRLFAYCRVSTIEQTTENQIIAMKRVGYDLIPNRVISETISGGVCAMQRPLFKNLIENKLEVGDTLIVLKLDRLGRNNIDVQQTITMLHSLRIKIICLDLPIADLSSSEGKLMLQLFSSFSEFERNRLKERTIDGLNRARASGKKLGRPAAVTTTKKVIRYKKEGYTQIRVSQLLGLSLSTIKRHWSL